MRKSVKLQGKLTPHGTQAGKNAAASQGRNAEPIAKIPARVHELRASRRSQSESAKHDPFETKPVHPARLDD
jgi:hypothetical protein